MTPTLPSRARARRGPPGDAVPTARARRCADAAARRDGAALTLLTLLGLVGPLGLQACAAGAPAPRAAVTTAAPTFTSAPSPLAEEVRRRMAPWLVESEEAFGPMDGVSIDVDVAPVPAGPAAAAWVRAHVAGPTCEGDVLWLWVQDAAEPLLGPIEDGLVSGVGGEEVTFSYPRAEWVSGASPTLLVELEAVAYDADMGSCLERTVVRRTLVACGVGAGEGDEGGARCGVLRLRDTHEEVREAPCDGDGSPTSTRVVRRTGYHVTATREGETLVLVRAPTSPEAPARGLVGRMRLAALVADPGRRPPRASGGTSEARPGR